MDGAPPLREEAAPPKDSDQILAEDLKSSKDGSSQTATAAAAGDKSLSAAASNLSVANTVEPGKDSDVGSAHTSHSASELPRDDDNNESVRRQLAQIEKERSILSRIAELNRQEEELRRKLSE